MPKQSRNRNVPCERLRKSAPPIFRILETSDTLEMARERLFFYCYQIDRELREGSRRFHPLELNNAVECLNVFRNILSRNKELQTGESSLRYLYLIAQKSKAIPDDISQGFIEEFVHLFKGMHGRSGMFSIKQVPGFSRHEGREAAELRSDDLDEISAYAGKYMIKYRSGLDDEIRARNSSNKKRIVKYFGGTESDWNEWRWQLRHIIRDSKTVSDLIEISDNQKTAIDKAIANRIPFGITPYYLSLMSPEMDSNLDISLRSQVLPPLDYVNQLTLNPEGYKADFDFMLEKDTSPIDLVTRRYPKIAIFKPYNTCPQICVYCQRNWEIDEVLAPHALAGQEKIEAAIKWFENHTEITEVLITGGDPLAMPNTRLQEYLQRFSEMPHIKRIRIGTRTLVTLPMRFTDNLINLLARFHDPGRREICVVTHFQHVSEISPEAVDAIQKIRKRGMSIYNQHVYTFFVSRRFENASLRKLLKQVGIDPYYTFNTKGKEEMSSYRVPIARLLQERREEARLFPGLERLDEPVFNVPRLGKNHIKAWQNHEVVMITPKGTRIFEFHPWEKNINPVDTYFIEDVSIYNYLQELKKLGENVQDYKSIWYYF